MIYPFIPETTSLFKRYNLKQSYGDMKELLLGNAQRAIGKELIIRAFDDADFASDRLICRSRSVFYCVL